MNQTLRVVVAAVVFSGCGVVEGMVLPDGGLGPKENQQPPPPPPPKAAYVCRLGDVGDLVARFYEARAKVEALGAACAGYMDALPDTCDLRRTAGDLEWARAGVAANRIRIDATKLAACDQAIANFDPVVKCWGAAPTFDALPAMRATCDAAMIGLVAPNGLCTTKVDCASGTCAFNGSCSRCGAYRTVGQSCSVFPCGPGLACSGSATVPLTCHTETTPISPGLVGTACSTTRPCASNLACLGNVCHPPAAAAAGASCETAPTNGHASNGCVGWQICAGLGVDKSGGITARGVCTVPARLGEACVLYPGEGYRPVSGSCFEGYVCDPTEKKCKPLPDVGEACDYEGLRCQRALRCDSDTMTCRAPPKLNEPCLDRSCAEPFVCDPDTDTCAALPALGAKCLGNACQAGLMCSAAKNCVLLPKVGAACTSACEAGAFCSGGVCIAAQAAGAPCTQGYQCQYGCDATTMKCKGVVVCNP